LTLIELVVAMVIVGIVVAATIFFAYPVQQSVELTGRAELTDIADNSLQRIGREVRLALPNSVRSAGACGSSCIEFIPVRTAGRYRAEASAPAVGCNMTTDASGSDELAFDVADTCFKSIGTAANATTIVNNSDFLVLNNTGLSSQDAYVDPGVNRVLISQADEQGGARERINFASFTFQRSLHDSPGKRFFVVTTPVAYVCASGTLTRHSGYAFGSAYTAGTAVVMATNVASCNFVYVQNLSPQIGLLTLQLTLSKALSPTTTETVTLYHSLHVSNVP
jgi:MSHA biogenesis protein MshO